MSEEEAGRAHPPLCGATRPAGSNNPRPCARAAHEDGTHIDRQGVAWTGGRTDQLDDVTAPFGFHHNLRSNRKKGTAS
ncbi:hypothetical protein ACFC0M_22010 [Streptomyces sp. NPDC056149]|uniref:hypothetical protein n=1 Tax=unclassified Streptomyces TaxID=2593676 RepID=UPI002381256E|nr:hypothetical protein [Streptomyces sp. WZ-12]